MNVNLARASKHRSPGFDRCASVARRTRLLSQTSLNAFRSIHRFLFGLFIAAILSTGALTGCARLHVSEYLSAEHRQEDFNQFCRFVADHYAYFDQKKTDWSGACALYLQFAVEARNRRDFVLVLENALNQLYDSHAHLGTHTPKSPRLVPSHAAIYATWVDGKAIVTDVKEGSPAALAGVAAGDEILRVNGEAVKLAIAKYAPTHLRLPDDAAFEYALQRTLAGTHDVTATDLGIRSRDGRQRDVSYFAGMSASHGLLTATQIDGVTVLRVHNSLGEDGLIHSLDRVLSEHLTARAFVLDLRDTPSGGNSTVAKGIMGRFVEQLSAYQRHELTEESRRTGIARHWVEFVAPRGTTLRQPLVVLVGRWTGSMGEGVAIGLNAARGAPVVGRPMAKLLGAIGEYELPHSRIVVRIPTEKLFHVDGRPREIFLPAVPIEGQHNGMQAADATTQLRFAVGLAHRLSASIAQ